MNIDIIKTSNDAGAVYIKYQLTTRPPSPIYEVTLPFTKNEDSTIEFKMVEETLRDFVKMFQHKAI